MNRVGLFVLGVPGLSFLVLVVQAVESLPSPLILVVPALIILLLVLLNGFFVAAEFAIIGVRPTQLEQMADEGSKVARRVLAVIESRRQQDQYIATAQLGITMASLGLAMYGEPKIAHFIEPYLALLFGAEPTLVTLHTVGSVIAISLLTYLHVVLGEMIPKALALMDPARLVLLLARPMQLSLTVLRVPVLILNAIGNMMLKVFQIPPAEGHERVLSPEELELLVAESAEGGLINVGEEEMILNIFDFSDRVVEQVMTPRPKVQAVPYDVDYQELLKFVTESRHSRFPVYEGDLDHIIGILHLKDLVRQAVKPQQSPFDLRLILRAAPAVPEDYPVEKLLAAFKRQRLHMAVVLDEFGGLSGIVTLEDLVEEIVGEVRDEFDLEKEPSVEIEPGVLEMDGNYLVDDLVEVVYLGSEDELPDVETVGGLVVSWLGRPPQKGDEVVHKENIHFKVLDVDRRAVSRVRIKYPVAPGAERAPLEKQWGPQERHNSKQ